MVRRCEYCDSPVPADATVCPVCRQVLAEETLEKVLPMLKRPGAPEVRALGVGERIWGVIRQPAAAYRDIGQRPDGAGPFMIILMNALVLAAFFLVVSSKITVIAVVNRTSGATAIVSILDSDQAGIFYLAALSSMVPNTMLGFVYLLFGTVFAHIAFKITGGSGRVGKTLAVVGYSMIPVLIMRLVALLLVLAVLPTYFIPDSSYWPSIIQSIYDADVWLIIDYMTTAAFVWVGFLLIFGIREAHDTSTVWAFVVSLACMTVLVWTFWQIH